MDVERLTFGFHNPNHAAALACALLPLCLGWRRVAWAGRSLAALLFVALLLTQSRTGLIVAALEWAAWWAMRRGRRMRPICPLGIPSGGLSCPERAVPQGLVLRSRGGCVPQGKYDILLKLFPIKAYS